jgi:hypothetical protein
MLDLIALNTIKESSYFCASLPLLSLLPVASNFQSTKSSNLKILFFTLAL